MMKDSDNCEPSTKTLQSRLSMLNQAVTRIKEKTDLQNVLQEVIDSAREITNARYGVIAFLTDPPRDYRVTWAPVDDRFRTWLDPSINAFPMTSPYTITGLNPCQRYMVRVRARYEKGPYGDWSRVAEAGAAPHAHKVTAADAQVAKPAPAESEPFRQVGALDLVCNQPGELTVSWDAPDDSGRPHDLFSTGLNAAEHQRLLNAPAGMQFFTYLNNLSQPWRTPDFPSRAKAEGFPGYCPLPAGPVLAAPIRHQGAGFGSICLAREKGEQGFSREDEELLTLFSSLAAIVIESTRRFRQARQAALSLKTVIETTPVGVAVFNPQSGDPTSLNEAAMKIFKGLDPTNRHLKRMLDSSTVRWTHGQEMSLAEFVFALLQPGKGTLRAEELVLSVPGGRSLAVLVNTSLLKMPDDEVKSVVVTLQDLSWMEEVEKLRAEFLGMVSHELRSPLASIKGSASNLRESLNTFTPADMVQFIRIIEMQADRMRDLLRELLDVARIETGSLSVTPEPYDAALLVDEACNTFLSGGGRDNVSVDLESDLPRVMADRWRTVQVLENLLSNAAKYSPEPSVIRVSAALDDGRVAFSVADDGRGVSPDRIPYLFRKFARIHGEEEQRQISGSGLGLAICKGIVEAHGGRIWAESAGPGLGSRFTFTLPVADREFENAAGRSSPHANKTAAFEKNAARILAVDDDPQTLRNVRRILSRAGYAPIVASKADEVLHIVRSDPPHLVLMDLMLPGNDGIELMKRILATAEVPVIFLSANGSDDIITTALDAGAVDYIVKPFSPTELVARVTAALRRP